MRGEPEQLRGGGQVPVARRWVAVPEVGGQLRQPGPRVAVGAVAVEHRAHRERVAQVVQPWRSGPGARGQPDAVAQLRELPLDVVP